MRLVLRWPRRWRKHTHELIAVGGGGEFRLRGGFDGLRALADSGGWERWAIYELIGGRRCRTPDAFGYKGGTTSTADLARMGVPIASGLVSDEKKL